MPEKFDFTEFNQSHVKISPTAWSVAYGRTFSDIPYSQEIFNELEAIRKRNGVEIPGGQENQSVAVQFEARHKLDNRIIRANKVFQVLEVASGLTPRGLELTQDSNMTIVEFDLPPMVNQKNKIIEEMERKRIIEHRPNLYLEEGNALSLGDLSAACAHFQKDKSIGVITEGLLRYLKFEEKARVARNILEILKASGGFWATSDTQNQSHRSEEAKDSTATFSKITGIDIESNYFIDINHARSFFEENGFDVETHTLSEVAEGLVSPQRMHLTQKQVNMNLEHRYIFVMRPKQ
jgi:O-methyltransferase involved in polyketide biosynthesis